MAPIELKALRRELGMTQEEFGNWLAQQFNAEQTDPEKLVSPYLRHRVSEWESGAVALPAKIELVLLRRQLAQRDREISELKEKQRQRQNP